MIILDKVIAANPAVRFRAPLSLRLDDGEHVAIVGSNGSGKTTIAHLLTGRYPLASGSIHYDFEPEPVYKNVKFIAFRDSYGALADASYYLQQRWNSQDCDASPLVRDTLKLAPVEKSNTDVFTLLEPLMDKQLVMLSSGEMRKYQLFKMIMSSPKILIIDNPYIGLDDEAIEMLTELLENLTRNIQIILLLARQRDIPVFVNRVFFTDGLIEAHSNNEDITDSYEQSKAISALGGTCEAFSDIPINTPVIEMNNVSIKYNNEILLDNINWTVHRGEKWAISGKNGSGKSTLLSLVCADNPQAYSCNISIFGKRRGSGESIWDIKKRIGYISPEMHRAYFENIPTIKIVASGFFDSIGLFRNPDLKQLEICEYWMTLFGIRNLINRSFIQLSDGEQRMALLVRAFVKNPELLILDEPFHGLDETNMLKAKKIIEDYSIIDGKTLIMVSHRENEFPRCINKRYHLEKS